MYAACDFEEVAHTAEIGLRIRAPDAPRLFACAARALFWLVGALDDAALEEPPARQFDVQLSAPDAESLLVEWLSELIWLYETSGLICAEAAVHSWTPQSLSATLFGRPPVQLPRLHVKGVTWHGLEVGADADGWTASVTLDI